MPKKIGHRELDEPKAADPKMERAEKDRPPNPRIPRAAELRARDDGD